MKAWVASGAHRIDRNGDGQYEQQAAVAVPPRDVGRTHVAARRVVERERDLLVELQRERRVEHGVDELGPPCVHQRL